MRKIVDKSVLIPYAQTVLKSCSLLYGVDSELIKQRLNAISAVYITDELKDSWFMCVDSKTHEVKINSKNCSVDSYGRLVINESDKAAFSSVFIHELVHAASTKPSGVGVRKYKDIDRVGMNEGLTQMITDDITGNVATNHFDGYFPLKTVCKILRCTLGPQVITDSFFYDSNIFAKSVDRLGFDNNYYDSLCKRMNSVENLKDIGRDVVNSQTRRIGRELYLKYVDLLYKDVALNVILPKLKEIKGKEKKDYLEKIIKVISEDARAKANIVYMITKYDAYSPKEIADELDRLQKESEDKINVGIFISLVNTEKDYLNKIMLRQDGSVVVLGNPNFTVESETAKDKIYADMFDAKYGSKMTPRYIDKIYKEIINGKPINVRNKSRVERYIIFNGLRRAMAKKNIVLLNDRRELENSETISKVTYISANEPYISFEDAKKICSKFGIFTSGELNDNRKEVVDKKYNITIDDLAIVEAARFANNWMLALGYSNTSKENVEKAFNPRYKVLYDDLVEALHKDFMHEGNTKRDFPSKYAKYAQTREIMKNFLATPEEYEWVYDYFKRRYDSDQYQVYRGVSYKELQDNSYLSREAMNLASKIVR